jgi:undecaprenyl-diphosphatase
MNAFDSTIIVWLNHFSQRSPAFDQLVSLQLGNNLTKGGVITALIWWAWFRPGERSGEHRAQMVATLLAGAVGIAVARAIALAAPFRERPLRQEGLNFRIPIGMSQTNLIGWSSFPSDHAVLFFALATGLLFVSRRAGVLAFVYTTVAIVLPRVYLGVHYPSDILAGAAVGVAIAWLSIVWLPRTKLLKWIMNFATKRPELFYPVFFLATLQIAEEFNGVRGVLGYAHDLMNYVTGRG